MSLGDEAKETRIYLDGYGVGNTAQTTPPAGYQKEARFIVYLERKGVLKLSQK